MTACSACVRAGPMPLTWEQRMHWALYEGARLRWGCCRPHLRATHWGISGHPAGEPQAGLAHGRAQLPQGALPAPQNPPHGGTSRSLLSVPGPPGAWASPGAVQTWVKGSWESPRSPTPRHGPLPAGICLDPAQGGARVRRAGTQGLAVPAPGWTWAGRLVSGLALPGGGLRETQQWPALPRSSDPHGHSRSLSLLNGRPWQVLAAAGRGAGSPRPPSVRCQGGQGEGRRRTGRRVAVTPYTVPGQVGRVLPAHQRPC